MAKVRRRKGQASVFEQLFSAARKLHRAVEIESVMHIISWLFYVVIKLLQAVKTYTLMFQREFERKYLSHSENSMTSTVPDRRRMANTPRLCHTD
jgi:hypothetical protein